MGMTNLGSLMTHAANAAKKDIKQLIAGNQKIIKMNALVTVRVQTPET